MASVPAFNLSWVQILSLEPDSVEERNACAAFAYTYKGKKLRFKCLNGQWMEAYVAGYFRTRALKYSRWVVAFEVSAVPTDTLLGPAAKNRQRATRVSKAWFAERSGDCLLPGETWEIGGAELGDIEVQTAKPAANDRFPHTCTFCGGRAYDGAYAFEHEATGTRACPPK